MEPADLPCFAQRAASEGYEEGQPGRPPARGTRTLRRCSFDARSGDHVSRLAEYSYGGRVEFQGPRRMRTVKDPFLPLRKSEILHCEAITRLWGMG